MTAKQVYEATSIELNKLQAPNLKLYEFNYLFNKAIYQYINKNLTIYITISIIHVDIFKKFANIILDNKNNIMNEIYFMIKESECCTDYSKEILELDKKISYIKGGYITVFKVNNGG